MNDWAEVERLIRQDLSPEQTAARLELEGGLSISHEIIYQHIYADKRTGGDLWRNLRCQKPHRKRYASGQERRGSIKNRVSIDDRPEIVGQKVRIGDWEGDSVIGKNHQGVLVTLAERKSRYVLAGALPSKHADGVTAKVNSLLRPRPGKRHTVTFDNGKEFAGHEAIAAELNADIYFAHPYHSWERGLNENSNGLLRQYFPKAMALADVTDEQVQQAVDRLNHRPRKVLGFKTPHEVFFGMEMRYTNTPLKVALRTLIHGCYQSSISSPNWAAVELRMASACGTIGPGVRGRLSTRPIVAVAEVHSMEWAALDHLRKASNPHGKKRRPGKTGCFRTKLATATCFNGTPNKPKVFQVATPVSPPARRKRAVMRRC